MTRERPMHNVPPMEDPDGGRRPKRKRWRAKSEPKGCFGRIFGAIFWVIAGIFELIFSLFN
ncbi:MAG: hypothetical protein AAFY88_04280 [Acidobacteriota bacterium]